MFSGATGSDHLIHNTLGTAASTDHLTHRAGRTQEPNHRMKVIMRYSRSWQLLNCWKFLHMETTAAVVDILTVD